MRIGVISDTHGDQAAIRQLIKLVTDVDLWLHAGDCSQDAEYLASLTAVPIIAARGNCDGYTTAKFDEFLEVTGKKIWLTHGHRYSVKYGIHEIVHLGKHYEMDVVVYGHTHTPDNRWCEGILIFNSGSANCSYGGRGTYGILEIDDAGQLVGKIVELNR